MIDVNNRCLFIQTPLTGVGSACRPQVVGAFPLSSDGDAKIRSAKNVLQLFPEVFSGFNK